MTDEITCRDCANGKICPGGEWCYCPIDDEWRDPDEPFQWCDGFVARGWAEP